MQVNAFDILVSSYTPTLGALIEHSPPVLDRRSGILAIGQEYTKGLSNLPSTVHELLAIKDHAKEIPYLQLDGEKASVEVVLLAMGEYSWVHLACHATQKKENPALSAFHLHDGDLTLSTIAKRAYKNKGLAFLSACQTATGDEKLPDEAVHLAAGMLMAGYPSVIATMWAIQDEDAPEVARQVYEDLLKGARIDCTRASRALHKAVAGLRRKVGERSFEQWVPYVHIGL